MCRIQCNPLDLGSDPLAVLSALYWRFDFFLVGLGWVSELLGAVLRGNKDLEEAMGAVLVLPSPATHAIFRLLKAGDSVSDTFCTKNIVFHT